MAEIDDHIRIVEQALRRVDGYTPAQITQAMKQLRPEQLARMAWRTRWVATRHAHQIPPETRRGTWLLLAGRGSGKTRVAAEEAGFACVTGNKGYRCLISSATAGDIRGTCIEGESGILNVVPSALVARHVRSLNEIRFHNGAYMGGVPASEPERFRGPAWHMAWCDEIAAWSNDGNDAEYAWDLMTMSVRLGKETFKIASSTPKPVPLIYRLLEEEKNPKKHVVVSRATTYSNLEFLSPDFKSEILKYEGTQIGLQEIYAQVLNPEATGIIKREWIQMWPYDLALPNFDLVIASLDTAYSEKQYDPKGHEVKQKTDPSACSVWGVYREKVTLKSGKERIMPRGILLYSWERWLGFPELLTEIKLLKRMRWGRTDANPIIVPLIGPKGLETVGRKIDVILIEEKASGKSIRQQLASEGVTTVGYNPMRADKLQRLHRVSPLLQKGFIWAVESDRNPGQKKFRSWAEPLIQQLCGYSGPGSILRDDLLDTATQALKYLDDQYFKYLPPIDAMEDKKKRQEREIESTREHGNPYDI
jgi:hypothetical protein